jgi:hypothetical protein
MEGAMVTGSKEDLTRVLSGSRNLAFDKEGDERDVDRVAALGMAQTVEHHLRQVENANRAARDAKMVSLGRLVMAFRQANEPKSHPNLLHMLTIEVAERLRYIENPATRLWTARAVARQAIQEHVIDMCPVCMSKEVVPDHDRPNLRGKQPMKVCPSCAGTGKRAYSIFERGREMFCKPNDVLVRQKVPQAIAIMKQAERKTEEHFLQTRGLDDY